MTPTIRRRPGIGHAVAALLAIAGPWAAAMFGADSPYQLAPPFVQLPSPWGEISGVALDEARGILYVMQRQEPPAPGRLGSKLPPILKIDVKSGKILKTWGEKLFVTPHGLRLDREGNLWATDQSGAEGLGHQVHKFDQEGRELLTLGTKGVSGDATTTLNGPCDVAIGRNGDIFVADGHDAKGTIGRILKFKKDGTFIKQWGRKGSGPGEFNVPHAMAFDSRGRLFVGDRGNNRLQIFDQDGQLLDSWTQFGAASGLFIAPDDTLYAADPAKGLTVGSARDGSIRFTLTDTKPESVFADAKGNVIYAGESLAGRDLKKFVRK